MNTSTTWRNALEPEALYAHFAACPPDGFIPLPDSPAPAFTAPFDLSTTADPALKARLARLAAHRWCSRHLVRQTTFVGTTVSEYAPLPTTLAPAALVRQLLESLAPRHGLLIIKDLPWASPLIEQSDNDYAEALVQACLAQGFLVLPGQALAYVPLDFPSMHDYLQALPKSARRYVSRRLRDGAGVQVSRCPTGPAFDDDARVDAYYAAYEAVYAQSELHFDHLSRAFLAALLRDAKTPGMVFEYRAPDGALLGWNLCYEHGDRLVDKYIGLSYPAARQYSLYFLSWFENLDYARARGLRHYVAGWSDPAVKALLGARFTPTRHAIYVRQPLLRALLRRLAPRFVSDQAWLPEAGQSA